MTIRASVPRRRAARPPLTPAALASLAACYLLPLAAIAVQLRELRALALVGAVTLLGAIVFRREWIARHRYDGLSGEAARVLARAIRDGRALCDSGAEGWPDVELAETRASWLDRASRLYDAVVVGGRTEFDHEAGAGPPRARVRRAVAWLDVRKDEIDRDEMNPRLHRALARFPEWQR